MLAGVRDTGKTCITGVDDSGEACISRVNDDNEVMPCRPEISQKLQQISLVTDTSKA